MEAKPVQQIERPGYPTRREVLASAASLALLNLTGYRFIFAASEDGKTVVAPIFKHGDGRGTTGCMVITPPVFLSEEEALQIVKEELAKNGVQLAPGLVLKDMTIAPRRTQQVEHDEKSRKIVPDQENARPLRLTGIDVKKSIAIKFICQSNYETLGGVDPERVHIVDRDGNDRGRSLSTVRS
jgi:hypothetical protein